jgi:predicted DNA-binding transcriptional regulator AlpA
MAYPDRVCNRRSEDGAASAPRDPAIPSNRIAWRMADLTALTGLSRRMIERERSAGRFPAPDRFVGRCPLWRPETVDAWLRGA